MDVGITHQIVAVVTLAPERVGGGAPIFYARDERELKQIARYIAKATLGMAHDLENGTYIVVRH
jgi:cell wall assembly regulator SMI1